MPKEVIHDDTNLVEYSVLCQCTTHAPTHANAAGTVGGRAWVDHDVFCDQSCPSLLTDAHPTRDIRRATDQSSPMAVEVRWSRDMDVQIATIDLPARDGDDVWLARALAAVKDLTTAVVGSGDVATATDKAEEAVRLLGSRAGGLYETLDRDRINKLIKVLKRARDQAFGADE